MSSAVQNSCPPTGDGVTKRKPGMDCSILCSMLLILHLPPLPQTEIPPGACFRVYSPLTSDGTKLIVIFIGFAQVPRLVSTVTDARSAAMLAWLVSPAPTVAPPENPTVVSTRRRSVLPYAPSSIQFPSVVVPFPLPISLLRSPCPISLPLTRPAFPWPLLPLSMLVRL